MRKLRKKQINNLLTVAQGVCQNVHSTDCPRVPILNLLSVMHIFNDLYPDSYVSPSTASENQIAFSVAILFPLSHFVSKYAEQNKVGFSQKD